MCAPLDARLTSSAMVPVGAALLNFLVATVRGAGFAEFYGEPFATVPTGAADGLAPTCCSVGHIR